MRIVRRATLLALVAGLMAAAPLRPGPCCPSCVPVVAPQTITRTVYRCKVVPYCVPCRSSLFGHRPAGPCGPPLFKRVLLKRFVKEERPAVRCEVRPAPPSPAR